MREKEKRVKKIKMLRNLNSFNGKHDSGGGGVIKLLVFIGVPIMLYIFSGLAYILPIFGFIGVMVPYSLWAAAITVGQQSRRLKAYRQRKRDVYSAATDLVNSLPIQEDGLIEYLDGTIAYTLKGFPKRFLKDEHLFAELEAFFKYLDYFDLNITLLNADEIDLRKMLPNLAVYNDHEVISDRINLINEAIDEAARHNTLFLYVFVVRASKYQVRELRQLVNSIPDSKFSETFNEIQVCRKLDVEELWSRDSTMFVDVDEMLRAMYAGEQTALPGFKVVGYDNDIIESQRRQPNVKVG